MGTAIDRLWETVQRPGAIDAHDLLRTLANASREPSDGDPRSSLLMRDAGLALAKHFGDHLVGRRVTDYPALRSYDDGDDRGFPTLEKRIMEATNPQVVRQMFEELGKRIRGRSRGRTTMIVGGSMPLILNGLLVRKTDDADVVDEVPIVIREQHDLLDEFVNLYGIRVSHFQSHYLPEGWRGRIELFDTYGDLDVHLIDTIDILTNKLFTRRPKDWNDLRVVFPRIDSFEMSDRVRTTTAKLREEPAMLAMATERWSILTGEESLPS